MSQSTYNFKEYTPNQKKKVVKIQKTYDGIKEKKINIPT